jgi:uncharacterized membrane protein
MCVWEQDLICSWIYATPVVYIPSNKDQFKHSTQPRTKVTITVIVADPTADTWISFVNICFFLTRSFWINMISVVRDTAGQTAGNGKSFESKIAQMVR